MLHIDVTLEDCRLIGDYNNHNQMWSVKIVDGMTGEEKPVTWTGEQLSAVLALGIGGDDMSFSGQLYAVAEPLVVGWPNTFRPFP
jgi:hypothetical protein